MDAVRSHEQAAHQQVTRLPCALTAPLPGVLTPPQQLPPHHNLPACCSLLTITYLPAPPRARALPDPAGADGPACAPACAPLQPPPHRAHWTLPPHRWPLTLTPLLLLLPRTPEWVGLPVAGSGAAPVATVFGHPIKPPPFGSPGHKAGSVFESAPSFESFDSFLEAGGGAGGAKLGLVARALAEQSGIALGASAMEQNVTPRTALEPAMSRSKTGRGGALGRSDGRSRSGDRDREIVVWLWRACGELVVRLRAQRRVSCCRAEPRAPPRHRR